MSNLNLSSVNFLANNPLPLEVGTFSVGPDGVPQRQERPVLHFTFDYTGIEVTAIVEPLADSARLRLDAVLAPMPFTAEGRERRRDVQTILSASRAGLKYGRFLLDDQRRIHLVSELLVDRPVTPVALVSAAARLLIVATPWIALLHRHLGPGGRSAPAAAAKPAAGRPTMKRVSGPAE